MVKISGTDHGAGDRTAGNAGAARQAAVSGSGSAGAAQTASPQSAEFQRGPQTLLHLIHTLGLPQDKLSASIVSFARYFSLPLNPGFLAGIRREVLTPAPEKFASQKEALSPKALAAKAAAALAAADKGVVLSREGLEKYAWFPPDRGEADPEDPEAYRESGGQSPDGGNSSGAFHNGAGGERREQGREDQPAGAALKAGEAVEAESLGEKIVQAGEQNPLLDLLNRLPGKNGQRWLVFPFSVAGETGELRVSLRLLLHETPAPGRPDRLALDISGGGQHNPAFRWLFRYDRQPGEYPYVKVYLWPPERQKDLDVFQKELAKFLTIPSKCITLYNEEECPLFVADCQDSVLRSINKEV
jgi:hypothetical protein